MNNKIRLGALFCVFSWFGLTSAQSPEAHERANSVSLIRVIANPKGFEGRRLRFAGYLDRNGLDKAVGIYLSEVDGSNFILSNSVDLKIQESAIEKMMGKYVILEGTYHAPTGPLADYANGYLDHISGIRPWAQGDVPK
jgi:hypothetical protein